MAVSYEDPTVKPCELKEGLHLGDSCWSFPVMEAIHLPFGRVDAISTELVTQVLDDFVE